MTSELASPAELLDIDHARAAVIDAWLADAGALETMRRRSMFYLPYPVAVFDATVAGEERIFVLTSARTPEERTGGELTVFAYPDDPFLPELAHLARHPGAQLLAYRPTRRAVLSLPGVGFAKVSSPARIARLAHAHDLLRDAGLPAAQVVQRHRGYLITSRVRGRPLTSMLNECGGAETYRQVRGLLDALPAAALELPARPSWCERIERHADLARALFPDPRIDVVARVVAAEIAAGAPGDLVPTHGDFYECNVLTDGRHITGLLDIDTLGPGWRIDDVACLLGHLSAVRWYRDDVLYRRRVTDLFRAACEDHDAARLAVRTAGVLVTLVPGAMRLAQRPAWEKRDIADLRLGIARGWLAAAEI
ncbi:hypothetical protein BSZ39_00830 [Bowdeniella nasicola]|uniref:Aminoglycoside phosphotransferase domain-containing protein n=1 Tax=Bowdeniella nasicola TaxID=208480 RepID=A0A1Q5Q5K0_9ACTO|nr:phosphotransferase [Bowdeniella nasicola]OKL55108.1 hypothetical protein BSZ39_00830 [Bowdeniella nasicola]